MEYNLEENPRKFAHMFKTKFKTMCRAFPSETRPRYVPVFKAVMNKNLDSMARSLLEIFMSEGFKEDIFISELK